MRRGTHKMNKGILGAILISLGALAAAPAIAADLPTKKPAPVVEPAPLVLPTWRFDLTFYGWIASMAGDAGARQSPTAPFHAGFGELLDHLRGGLSGDAIVRYDHFIGGVDFIWCDLGTHVNIQAPSSPLVGAGADLELDAAIVSAFGGVRLPIGSPDLDLYGIVGARYFYDALSITLRSPASGFERDTSASKSWVDPIVGLYGHYRINDRWFVNGAGDIGGLDKSATGQALAAVGYDWTKSFATTLGYRVLYAYDKQNASNGSFRMQEWVYGPYVALRFSF